MFDTTPFGVPPTAKMKRMTPEVKTISECCDSPMSMETTDDFEAINKNKTESLIMTVRYICNKCGNYCKIKQVTIDE